MLNLAYGYVSLLNQTNYFDIILSSDILKTSIIPETIIGKVTVLNISHQNNTISNNCFQKFLICQLLIHRISSILKIYLTQPVHNNNGIRPLWITYKIIIQGHGVCTSNSMVYVWICTSVFVCMHLSVHIHVYMCNYVIIHIHLKRRCKFI